MILVVLSSSVNTEHLYSTNTCTNGWYPSGRRLHFAAVDVLWLLPCAGFTKLCSGTAEHLLHTWAARDPQQAGAALVVKPCTVGWRDPTQLHGRPGGGDAMWTQHLAAHHVCQVPDHIRMAQWTCMSWPAGKHAVGRDETEGRGYLWGGGNLRESWCKREEDINHGRAGDFVSSAVYGRVPFIRTSPRFGMKSFGSLQILRVCVWSRQLPV